MQPQQKLRKSIPRSATHAVNIRAEVEEITFKMFNKIHINIAAVKVNIQPHNT